MVLDEKPGDTAGRTFAGGVRLRSSVAMTVSVSIGRAGDSSTYEGVTRTVELEPGEFRDIHLCARFRNAHRALKLQVYVTEAPAGKVADLVIDSICLGEIPDRLAADHMDGKLDFRAANAMLRRGDLDGIELVYRLLHERHPLRIYQDNAKMASAEIMKVGTQ